MTYLKSIKNCLYGISEFCIICFVLFRLCSVLFTQLRLELYGEKTKAVVTKVWINKAYPRACYEFEVNGTKYHGDLGKCSNDIAVGDTVTISFLPNNPECNMIINE